MNKVRYKSYFFLVLLVIVILFFLWSRLFWVSLCLVILADLLSSQFIPAFLKRRLPKSAYTIIKYFGLLTLPICIAIFIRTFFFDVYFVPSSSMERTLSPNDYVVVNKFLYGVKIPNYRQDVPVIGGFFKDSYSEHHYDLYTPLKAFKNYSREDIVVFKSTETNSKFLVKRIIGLPGDTLQIKNTDVFINSNKLQERANYCYNYNEKTNRMFDIYENLSNREFNALNAKQKSKLKKKTDSISNSYFIFPYSKQSQWTRDDYGKIIIPKKGQTITISLGNYDHYKTIIKSYEQVTFQLQKGEHKTYTFKNDYYFMMGDNRHNSVDSRSYGFVPESYIQGKMITKF